MAGDCKENVAWENMFLKDTEAPQWSLEDYNLLRTLGKGQFGHVYLAQERRSGFLCALKQINKAEALRRGLTHLLRREIEIHSHLLHPNILEFYDWFVGPVSIYLITEIAPGGELMDKIVPNGLSEDRASKVLKQMIDAIDYCHLLNIIHRDIKPENILVDYAGACKLSDFGWAAHLPIMGSGSSNEKNYMQRRRQTYCGTLDYLAPETITKSGHGKDVDLWALGVLAFECVTAEPPFPCEKFYKMGMDELEARERQQAEIKKGDIEAVLNGKPHLTADLQDFLRRALKLKPEERMSTTDMLKHPWITKHNNDL